MQVYLLSLELAVVCGEKQEVREVHFSIFIQITSRHTFVSLYAEVVRQNQKITEVHFVVPVDITEQRPYVNSPQLSPMLAIPR